MLGLAARALAPPHKIVRRIAQPLHGAVAVCLVEVVQITERQHEGRTALARRHPLEAGRLVWRWGEEAERARRCWWTRWVAYVARALLQGSWGSPELKACWPQQARAASCSSARTAPGRRSPPPAATSVIAAISSASSASGPRRRTAATQPPSSGSVLSFLGTWASPCSARYAARRRHISAQSLSAGRTSVGDSHDRPSSSRRCTLLAERTLLALSRRCVVHHRPSSVPSTASAEPHSSSYSTRRSNMASHGSAAEAVVRSERQATICLLRAGPGRKAGEVSRSSQHISRQICAAQHGAAAGRVEGFQSSTCGPQEKEHYEPTLLYW